MAQPFDYIRNLVRGRSVLRVAAFGLLGVFLAGIFAGGIALAWLWPRCSGNECPSVERLKDYRPAQASLVYDREGGLIGRLAPEQRIVVPLQSLPPLVTNAFLAVEDRRFFEHGGVDWRRTLGAFVRDLRTQSLKEGFSTITMQLARNVFPAHLTRARTLRRKVWEVVLAHQIERHFSKQQILELYLNQIYLGDGRYGVEAAARNYFGRSAKDLTVAQAAVLAALPKAPSLYDPRRSPDAAKARRNLVLHLMQTAGVITEKQEKAARKERLRLTPPEETGSAPWVEQWVRRELRDRFGNDAEVRGLRVHTTVDPKLQTTAETELNRQISAIERGGFGKFRGTRCAGKTPIDDPEECLQGLVIALHPVSGDVLAIVGGRDHSLSQFDRVLQAKRQAGSTFKPFVYAAALLQGMPTTTLLGDGPEPQEGDYTPAEGGLAPQGPMTLREALRTSSNRAAVELGRRVGASNVAQMAKLLGINTPIPEWPSMFLGAADVVPIELTLAYAAFINGGYRIKPRLIARVETLDGMTIWTAPVDRTAVLPPGVAFIMSDLLQTVVEFGTGRGARANGPENVLISGKTGTTNKAQDTWFVGATGDAVVTSWIGFDRPRTILKGATGGRLVAPLVGRVLREHYKRNPPPAPQSPPGDVVNREVDVSTGKIATLQCPRGMVVREWFLTGAAPNEECPAHRQDLSGFFDRVFGGIFRR